MAKSNSTRGKHSAKPQKPPKPREDFPLFPHDNGLWCRKIKGTHRYFGSWADDPKGEAALLKYTDEKDDWYAGRVPRSAKGLLTVEQLCNVFLQRKEQQADSGDIKRSTFLYFLKTTCPRLVEVFGRKTPVESLQPVDFQKLVAHLAKTQAPMSRKTEIERVRAVFNFAYRNELIDKPVRYGDAMAAPSKRAIRRQQNGNGGRQPFTAEEIRSLLKVADPIEKAWILLGINCGMGNHDIGTLPLTALDLDKGWHSHTRPKTQEPRRGKLWEETVAALRAAIALRPEPKDPGDAGLVFIYRKTGRRFVGLEGDIWRDRVFGAFRTLMKKAGIDRKGLSFYSLRHSFETVAGGCRDQVAVDFAMGHVSPGMGTDYRHDIADERLEAVADCVRQWLWPPELDGDGDDAKQPRRQRKPRAAKPTAPEAEDRPRLRLFAG